MKSSTAQVASMIRKYIKTLGIKATVRSSVYSGGSSVNVETLDTHPIVAKMVRNYCEQFQMGHFDGSVDMYNYDNRRTDIPQCSYVFYSNRMSPDMSHAIKNWIAVEFRPDYEIESRDVFNNIYNEYDEFWTIEYPLFVHGQMVS